MAEKKGTISVKTKDILPIIKKWLYSEHDIFIRELVANATDAITKRATQARTLNQELPDGSILISVNKTNKTISIEDNGLGMSVDEVEKYIAQVAFSGAEEFVKKMEQAGEPGTTDIIGKFGLGFYSSFMVADKVEIETLSMAEGAKAVSWSSTGDEEYIIGDSSKEKVGTKITLHVNEENESFLNAFTLQESLRKHCDFMPYEIGVLDEERKEYPKKEDGTEDTTQAPLPNEPTIVNETTPIWKKDPTSLKDEDYINFYRSKFPMDGDPLFWIHLNVDHPFTLNGVLFFPKVNPNKPFNQHNIKLYSKQVFVSDDVKNIIPEFLSLLKGYIDSTDIPLNVSRSSLQGDPNIKKISNYIVKKVADALKKLWNTDREKYEKIWPDSGLFIKYGCISDTKFDELMRQRIVFPTSEGKYMTLGEYKESIPEKYKEKMGDLVLYYEKEKSEYALRAQLVEEGIHSFETDEYIDPHFMQHAESHKVGDNTVRFSSVDSEIANILETENTDENDIKIKDLFTKFLNLGEEKKEDAPAPEANKNLELEIQKIKNAKAPAYLKTDEQMKRFSKMAQSMGNDSMFPVKKTLVINPNNPLIKNALTLHEKGGEEELVGQLCKHVEDLARVSSEGLDAKEREQFVQRSQNLIEKLTSLAL